MAISPFDRAEIEPARAELEQLGYRIEIRKSVWVECRISSSDEDWVARGSDDAEAFTRALALLFPSRAARVGWRELLGSSVRRKSVPAQPASQPPPSTDEPTRQRPALTATPEFSLDAPTIELPLVAPARPSDGSDLTVVDPPAAARKKSFDERTTAEVKILSDSERTRPPTAAGDVLRDLEELRFRVLASEAEIALLSPELQRLHLLGWTARTRELEASVGASPAVEFAAGTIVALLARMARAYASGTLHALARTASPAAAAEDLRVASAFERWDEVAARSAAMLDALADGARESDDYGWADASSLIPPPAEPDAMLERVSATLESTECNFVRSSTPDPRAVATLEDCARRLRWLRTHASDDVAWGTRMGTLRRIAAQAPALATLARTIDASFRPSDGWAAEVGESSASTITEASLTERLRSKLSGKRLLLLAHRDDPDSKRRLAQTSSLVVDWTTDEPARLAEHAERVAQRAWDFVVSAIGFRSLAADRQLAAACLAAKVPMLKIDQPAAGPCTRALARELGLIARARGQQR